MLARQGIAIDRSTLASWVGQRRPNSKRCGVCCATLARFGRPEIFSTDQGSQFTSVAFTGRLAGAGIRISMDAAAAGSTTCSSNGWWRSLKYEDVYLKGSDGREARAGIASWIGFYNGRRPHQALDGRTPMAVWREGVSAHWPTTRWT